MGYYRSCDKVVFSGSLAASQSVTEGLPVSFTRNLSAGVTYTDTSVTIRRPGVYRVSVDASAATAASAATDVTLQLQRNGTQVGKVQSTATSSSSTDFVNLSFDAVINVEPTCCPLSDNAATLTFVNSGEAATYAAMTVAITRE